MPDFTIHLDDPQDAIENLRRAGGMGLAAQIEAQLPTAPVEEPTEFGSIVAARVDAHWEQVQWHVSPMNGKHYWESEFGAVGLWSELRDVEVLRVGIGEPAPSADGVVLSTLKLAEIRMFGTVDGDLLSDESELPVGELRRLLWTEDADGITPWENDAGLPAPSPAEAVEADEDTCICSGRILPFPEIDPECPEHGTKPEPSPVQVEAEPLVVGDRILSDDEQSSVPADYFRVDPALAEDPIEALVQAFVADWFWPGTTKPDGLSTRLDRFAARVRQVAGQQALTEAAAAARKEAADSRTNNGRSESEGLADWLDEYAKTVAS